MSSEVFQEFMEYILLFLCTFLEEEGRIGAGVLFRNLTPPPTLNVPSITRQVTHKGIVCYIKKENVD